MSLEFSDDIENILENIKQNCIILSSYNKKKYFELKGLLKYFRIPTIVLSSMNSVFSVGLQVFIDQRYISIINCLISLICSVIVSLELFLNIQSDLENYVVLSKQFHLLSVDIFKITSLDRRHRLIDAKSYLDSTFNSYMKLLEKMNLLEATKKLKQELNKINFPQSPSFREREIRGSDNSSLSSDGMTTNIISV